MPSQQIGKDQSRQPTTDCRSVSHRDSSGLLLPPPASWDGDVSVQFRGILYSMIDDLLFGYAFVSHWLARSDDLLQLLIQTIRRLLAEDGDVVNVVMPEAVGAEVAV